MTMENKESLIERFAKGVNSLKDEMLGDKQGYILFAYNEAEDGRGQENIFVSNGRFGNVAEMFFACMKSDPALANIMTAAVNAYSQSRMMEMAMKSETPADEQDAANVSTKKTKHVN